MNCDVAIGHVIDRLASGVDLPDAAADHIAGCGACNDMALQFRELWHDLGEIRSPMPPLESYERTAGVLAAAMLKANSIAAVSMRTGEMPTPASSRRRVIIQRWLVAAAGVCGVALGAGIDRVRQAKPAPNARVAAPATPVASQPAKPHFLLLLHKGNDSTEKLPAAERLRVVDDYRAWARALARDQRLVIADELGPDAGRWLAARGGSANAGGQDTPESPRWISGYFIIAAPNYEAATAIASQCPHLKYGGTIEVRAVRQEEGGGDAS